MHSARLRQVGGSLRISLTESRPEALLSPPTGPGYRARARAVNWMTAPLVEQVAPRQLRGCVDLLIERLDLGLRRQMHDGRQDRGWPDPQLLVNGLQEFIVLHHIFEDAQQEMR